MQPPARRRWRSISLRTLLILFTVVAVWLGSWIHGSREQELAIKALQTRTDILSVWYDDKFADEKSRNGSMPGEFSSGVKVHLQRKSWIPDSIQSRFGKDYFHDAITVTFTGARNQSEVFRQVARIATTQQLTPHVAVRDQDIEQIAALRHLKRLDLMDASPKLTNDGVAVLARMSSIEALSIYDASLSDRALAAISSMRQLKELTLGHQLSPPNPRFRFTDAGVQQLESLTNLVELAIDCPKLSGNGLKHIAQLRNLKQLKLNAEAITDDDLKLLGSLQHLVSLELRNATFSGSGFERLTTLSQLEWLQLDGTKLSDEAISHLAKLPALRSLGVDRAQFTAAGLEQLAAAEKLYQIQVRSSVSGDLVRLRKMLPGRSLYIDGSFLQ